MPVRRAVVFRTQDTAQGSAHPQHREVGPGYQLARYQLGPIAVAHVKRVTEPAEHAGEDLVVVAKLGIHGIGQLAAVPRVVAVPGTVEGYLHELLRALDG